MADLTTEQNKELNNLVDQTRKVLELFNGDTYYIEDSVTEAVLQYDGRQVYCDIYEN